MARAPDNFYLETLNVVWFGFIWFYLAFVADTGWIGMNMVAALSLCCFAALQLFSSVACSSSHLIDAGPGHFNDLLNLNHLYWQQSRCEFVTFS